MGAASADATLLSASSASTPGAPLPAAASAWPRGASSGAAASPACVMGCRGGWVLRVQRQRRPATAQPRRAPCAIVLRARSSVDVRGPHCLQTAAPASAASRLSTSESWRASTRIRAAALRARIAQRVPAYAGCRPPHAHRPAARSPPDDIPGPRLMHCSCAPVFRAVTGRGRGDAGDDRDQGFWVRMIGGMD